MLDERLTAEERRALLFLLTAVALSDGKLTDSEVRFVQRLALPIGVEVGELLGSIDRASTRDLAQALRRPVAARIALMELLRLAHVDDVYSHVEQTAIREHAKALGVGQRTLEKLEEWVQREWEALTLGRRLIDEG